MMALCRTITGGTKRTPKYNLVHFLTSRQEGYTTPNKAVGDSRQSQDETLLPQLVSQFSQDPLSFKQLLRIPDHFEESSSLLLCLQTRVGWQMKEAKKG